MECYSFKINSSYHNWISQGYCCKTWCYWSYVGFMMPVCRVQAALRAVSIHPREVRCQQVKVCINSSFNLLSKKQVPQKYQYASATWACTTVPHRFVQSRWSSHL